jgi:hypothetical protein
MTCEVFKKGYSETFLYVFCRASNDGRPDVQFTSGRECGGSLVFVGDQLIELFDCIERLAGLDHQFLPRLEIANRGWYFSG